MLIVDGTLELDVIGCDPVADPAVPRRFGFRSRFQTGSHAGASSSAAVIFLEAARPLQLAAQHLGRLAYSRPPLGVGTVRSRAADGRIRGRAGRCAGRDSRDGTGGGRLAHSRHEPSRSAEAALAGHPASSAGRPQA
ncbi:hypothetical protein GCM10010420_55140 [Streptomyces glaucosporus]|uniref:Uncharacterized protein n=1 Tax=Streptomyces glaucosporus TaxID=284044 RepID=A0ABN3J0P0_9ACTN